MIAIQDESLKLDKEMPVVYSPLKVTNKYVNMDKIEQIARMCHQTNKAWCELNGDNSQKTGTKHNNGKETALSKA
jgi:hypothetical protein